VSLKVTHFVEHLNAIALAVTHVHQAGVADRYTMHDLSKHTARSGLGFFLCGLPSPLAKEAAFAIKHRHSAGPITIGDVDVTIISVYNDTGRVEELGGIRIKRFTLAGAVGGVENASLADLQQEFSFVAILLNDAVAVSANPNIVLLIDGAAVN